LLTQEAGGWLEHHVALVVLEVHIPMSSEWRSGVWQIRNSEYDQSTINHRKHKSRCAASGFSGNSMPGGVRIRTDLCSKYDCAPAEQLWTSRAGKPGFRGGESVLTRQT
jgi:hypothetical protein